MEYARFVNGDRMKDFFRLMSRTQFLELLEGFEPLDSEVVPLTQARGRVLAQDILAPEDLPPFSRSTMDGFAVRAKATFGASESEPSLFKVVGEVPMGSSGQDIEVGPLEAAKIWTGGALPRGADSVVMVEFTHPIDEETIEVFKPVAPGENVIAKGEDYREGDVVLEGGRVLGPSDLGALAGLGIVEVPVVKRPKVAVLSTGDELVPPDATPRPGEIRDINSTTLHLLIEECGGIPVPMGIIPDDFDSLKRACEEALREGADVVLLSGGSSVGRRDYTLDVFRGLKGCDVLAHGVSIRPGKPTILAKQGNRALFGLPGHVASAIVVFLLFVRPLVRYMSGRDLSTGLNEVRVRCGQEFPSVSGREDFVRVRLEDGPEGLSDMKWAYPVWGKSGLISPLVKAHGLLKIPRDSEGLERGEEATCLLFSYTYQ